MKRTYKKLICVILSAVLLLSALPLTVHAAATTYRVSTPQELRAAVTAIKNAGAGDYEIQLTKDITTDTAGISFSGEGVVVTIIGNNHSFTCPAGQNVQAWNGATVILGDGETALTLIGGDKNDVPGVVYIFGSSSRCVMNDKVTIKDNKSNNYLGGGVTVESGTFIMNGGTIDNCGVDGGSVCFGGGVAVFNDGYFEMNNGTIKNCYVVSNGSENAWQVPWVAGGGVFVCRADFTMKGGTIENCTASNYESSSEKDAIGGGIAVITSVVSCFDYGNYGYLDSNFTMNAGTIKNCSATVGGGALAVGMAYVDNRQFGKSYNNPSGSDNPGIYLNGGSIIGNEASAGGAIFLNWIRPNVNIKNMTIDSNNAGEGGAVDIYSYWTHALIENCTITNNTSESKGGAILLENNDSSVGTQIIDTTVTDNTSKDRGAGVYYDAKSKLTISGANIIQDNTYNGKQNNLNVLSLSKPVYVNGDLTGSQIGLSDPTLWDDGKDDTDPEAVSTNYLTSGYKTYNSVNPGTLFTSDHETWIADFSDVDTNEVRLVRKTTVDYHINNRTIAKDKYNGNDIFTSYVAGATGKPVTVGGTIDEFYTIPEIKPTEKNSCPYIFKGWYYDKANDNDENPVDFDTDKYVAGRDIYAHWIEVKDVAKDSRDKYNLPAGETAYGGFDLTGVQVRGAINDTNFDGIRKPGGLRFMTSLSTDVVNEINALQDSDNNIEYGYVAATRADWITAHQSNGDKLQYVSTSANGKNTSTYNKENPQDYFGFATNVNCTSEETNASYGIVPQDHRKFSGYLLYTLVITYENGTGYDKNVLARPYIKYTDANGLERVAYSEYRGRSNTLGGCYTSYNANVEAPEQEG